MVITLVEERSVFGNLNGGDAFTREDHLYIRIHKGRGYSFNAFCVSTSIPLNFEEDEVVTPVDIQEVRIQVAR